jgi:tau tubulin kinase
MKQRSLFHSGDVVGEEYEVKRKIGEGQFSEVYQVQEQASTQALVRTPASRIALHTGGSSPSALVFAALTPKSCDVQFKALKIDRKRDVRTVKKELEHLNRLKDCSRVCNVHGSGVENGRFFIVMDLLGANLAETMRREFGGHMPVEAVKSVATGLLDAVEELHRAGYVHRDVKPANFALHSPSASVSKGTWIIIDFGLARRYVDENGNVIPERENASFRGSTTYASVFAHDDKDLGRRDDLWSWFYILVEMLEGTLFAHLICFDDQIDKMNL